MTIPQRLADVELADLVVRVPGQASMAACLRRQDGRPPRGRLARFAGAAVLGDGARPWYGAAVAERTTARLLEALGPEWIVLHGVPLERVGTHLDHLVIGPAGIITVTTRQHRDASILVDGEVITVNGRRSNLIGHARSRRRRVLEVLDAHTFPDPPVASLVVVVEPARVRVTDAPEDVLVLDARRLVRTLRRMPAVLGHDGVWALAGALATSATWSDAQVPDGGDVRSRFAALEREVRIARAVRLSWTGGLAAALAAGAIAAATAVPDLVAMLVPA